MTLGRGVASSDFSNVRIATVTSMHIFPSLWFLISLVVLLFRPHKIMLTLFFGAGGGELGDSGSVSLPLLFVETLSFRLGFGVTGSSSSSLVSSLVFFIFVLTGKRCSTFFSRVAFVVMKRTIFAEVVC